MTSKTEFKTLLCFMVSLLYSFGMEPRIFERLASITLSENEVD